MSSPPDGPSSAKRHTGLECTRMTPEHWALVNDALQRAMDLTPERRTACLDGACADQLLRLEVESLLAAQSGSEPSQPAIECQAQSGTWNLGRWLHPIQCVRLVRTGKSGRGD